MYVYRTRDAADTSTGRFDLDLAKQCYRFSSWTGPKLLYESCAISRNIDGPNEHLLEYTYILWTVATRKKSSTEPDSALMAHCE